KLCKLCKRRSARHAEQRSISDPIDVSGAQSGLPPVRTRRGEAVDVAGGIEPQEIVVACREVAAELQADEGVAAARGEPFHEGLYPGRLCVVPPGTSIRHTVKSSEANRSGPSSAASRSANGAVVSGERRTCPPDLRIRSTPSVPA